MAIDQVIGEFSLCPAVSHTCCRLVPPSNDETPAGSQPNDRYGSNTLNWRGALGPEFTGPVLRGGPAALTARATAATAAAASTGAPATQARCQRRRARPRRWASWVSTCEEPGSLLAISVNSARTWHSIIVRHPSGDVVSDRRGCPAASAGSELRPERAAHRAQGPGGLAFHRSR